MDNKKENKKNKKNLGETKKNSYNVSPEQEKLLKIAKELKGQNSAYYFHGSSPCCSEDTRILTIHGEKPISDIKSGDIVLSESNSYAIVVMVNKVPVLNHEVLEIKFNDGASLKVSPDHPTYDMRLFKDLKVGEIVSNKKITKISLIPYKYKYTYDILPDSLSGNYYANGVLIGSTLKQVLYKGKLRTA